MRYIRALFAIGCILSLLGCVSGNEKKIPLAENGVLNLTDWDFNKDGAIKVSGEWEFYWEQLLTPADFTADFIKQTPPKKTCLIKVAGPWDGIEVDGKKLTRDGYATYRLKILLNDKNQRLAFRFVDIMSAYVVYVNGEKIKTSGVVGTTLESMEPEWMPDVVDFSHQGRQLDVLIAVSNFHYRKGGIVWPFYLGDSKLLAEARRDRVALELFLFGSILFMGIYHIGLYVVRRTDNTPLIFGIFCLLVAGRTFVISERYGLRIFPSISPELLVKIEYITFIMAVALFAIYVRRLFQGEFSKKVLTVFVGVCSIYSIFIIVVPSRISTYCIESFQIITLLILVYTTYTLVLALVRNRQGIRTFLMGGIILFVTVINDILHQNKVVDTGNFAAGGLFIFFFFQSFLLSIRFSKAFSKVEELSAGLSRAEKKFRGIFEGAIDGIFQISIQGKILIANSSAAKILGFDSPQELMDSVGDFIGKVFVDQKKLSEILESFESKKALKGFEFDAIHKNGNIICLQLNASLHSEKDQEPFVEGIISDITEIRWAEKLQIDKEAAIASNQAKSEFLANMSHEIRTPMNGVLVAAELALSEDLPPKAEQYLQIINHSGQSLLGIINDILDFSKIEAGKLDVETIPFDLNALLLNIGDLFSGKASEKQVEMIFDIEHGAPMALLGDPVRVEQIFRNLVGNSIKFTREGGIITVGLDIESITSETVVLKFLVSDTGKGMKKKYLENLFDAFTQEDASTTRKYGGTGLGMSICKQLIDLMDGEIWATSELGRGTNFYFTLKFKRQPVEKEKEYIFSSKTSKLRVMVIDDNRASLDVVGKILDSFGYDSIRIQNPGETLGMLENNTVDLVITDWNMPEINGMELAAMIKNQWPEMPIIMLTGFGKNTDKTESERIGINGYLTKPVNPSVLFDSIKDVFGEREKEKQVQDEDITYQQKLWGIKILLAEDNKVNQALAKAVLRKAGIQIDIANNGRKAVDAVYRTDYAAVLMDMQMPEMDGYEATRAIRKDPVFAKLPIIAMTANAMKGDEEKCLEAGMDGYVPKPINQDILFKTLWSKLEIQNTVLDESPEGQVPEPDNVTAID